MLSTIAWRLIRAFLTLVLMIMISTWGFAWGHEGHRIIADIAQDHLAPAARAALIQLLGTDRLEDFATWADDIRPQHRETAPWHYVNIPGSAQGYDSARDCVGGDCVVQKIDRFSAILRDRKQTLAERQAAAKWLIHLVADIHQPFHAVADARGGNDILVTEFGVTECGRYRSPCELHGLWDSDLIRIAGRREGRYAVQIETMIEERHLQATGTPEIWANESFTDAKAALVESGTNIDEAYYERELPVVNQRLALAGLRLAALLNSDLKP